MLHSRRQFIHHSALVTMGGALAPMFTPIFAPVFAPVFAQAQSPRIVPGVKLLRAVDRQVQDTLARLADPDRMRTLALQGVDAAKQAGASYADVRITRTVVQTCQMVPEQLSGGRVSDEEQLVVGIRALVQGAWGFAASSYWDSAEMTVLAREAVLQATANARGTFHPVIFEPIPAVTGQWIMPGIDPFAVSIEEKLDFFNSWRQSIVERPVSQGIRLEMAGTSKMVLQRQERTMASTEGTVISQIVYECDGRIGYEAVPVLLRDQGAGRVVRDHIRGLHPQGKGWEMFAAAKIPDQLPVIQAHAAELFAVPRKPVSVGRYDVVFDAETMARMVHETIGLPTELDRAVGLEANASGTSYLGPDPLKLLGVYQIGTPQLTVTANRSTPGDLATVRWDDEGVVPDTFPLVRDGILVDYQTTREQAVWLAPYYQKAGKPVHSHGCAGAPSAFEITLQQRANLIMTPGQTEMSFEALVAGTTTGLACVRSGPLSMDYQGRRGYGQSVFREITNGKLGAVVDGVFTFDAPEFWRNLLAIGGAASATTFGEGMSLKGQPLQVARCSVTAVPTAVKNISIIAETI